MDEQQIMLKRKPLSDHTNTIPQSNDEDRKRWAKFDETQWLPLQPKTKVECIPELPPNFVRQNVHPMLAFYQHDLKTDTMSHDAFARLLAPDNGFISVSIASRCYRMPTNLQVLRRTNALS